MTAERADYCMLVVKVMSLLVNVGSGLGLGLETEMEIWCIKDMCMLKVV